MNPPKLFACLALSCVFVVALARGQDRLLPPNLSGQWIQTGEEHTDAYKAPILSRLFLSLRPWGEVGASNGKMKLETRQVTIAGGFADNERPTISKIMPQSYGLGISGKVTF